MFCRNCGAELSDNAYACTKCGVIVGAGNRFCAHCGAEPDPKAVICVKCGRKIEAEIDSELVRTGRENKNVHNIAEAVASLYFHYVGFSGRACRAEYWYSWLYFNLIQLLPISAVSGANSVLVGIGIILLFGTALPMLAVTVRRLHDTGRSGWWCLLGLIFLVGWIVLLVFMCIDSKPGYNKYGSNPKGR